MLHLPRPLLAKIARFRFNDTFPRLLDAEVLQLSNMLIDDILLVSYILISVILLWSSVYHEKFIFLISKMLR